MRRLYICPLGVWREHLEHFHASQGSHFIDLGEEMILVATDFSNEAGQEIWEAHPDVAPLPDPTFEGSVTLKAHAANSAKKLNAGHLGHLARIGVLPGDSVMDVSRKSRALHPLVRVGNLL